MTITEEFEKRQAEKPDKWTLSWWNEQFQEVLRAYRGASHGINQVLAYNEDLGKANKELQGRLQALEAAGELDRAKIGELQARVERQAEFLTKLKQKKDTA